MTITESDQPAKALAEREAKLAAVFRTAPVGIAVIVNRIITEVNDTMCRMAGYSAAEMIGSSTRILYDNDADYDAMGAALYDQLKLAGQVTREIVARRKDGSRFPILLSASPLDTADLSKGVVFTSLDISEQQRASEALKERESKLDAIFRAAPVGIGVLVNRVIKEVNDTMCRMTGYNREELIGQSTRMVYASVEEFERAGIEGQARLAAGGIPTQEMKMRRKDGNRLDVLFTVAAFDPADLAKGVVFTAQDIDDRKRFEESVLLSEEKYRLLFETGNDAVFFHDEDGRFIEVNDRACRSLGYDRAEFLTMNIKDIDDPDFAVDANSIARQFASTGSAVFEQVHLARDGRRISVEINTRLVEVSEQKLFLSHARDISERKKSEAILRHSLSLLTATLEATADGILVVDLAGKVQRYSSRFAKMWNIPKALLKENDDERLLAFVIDQIKDPEKFLEKVHKLYAQPDVSGCDVVELKDGRIFERYSRPQRLEREIVGRVWSFRDVTESRGMEAKLLRAAEEWRATFDAIVTPVSIQDRDFRILRVNRAFAEAMKTSPEQLIGKTCFEICHGSHEPAKGCPHVQTLEKGIPAEVEVHNAEKGTYTMVSTYPMFGPSGEVVASVHISQDITERRKMQERLMVTNRLASVGELAAGIAHEINNPLTGVLGFSELVLSADIPEAVRADVEVIHAEARRAADVVKNLLIFARRHHQERNAISINEVLNKVLALRAYEQKLNNVAIFADLDPNLPAICADNFQLQQVFLNIIINAEYFMTKAHGRGKLVIKSAYRPEERVIRVAFTDDGPGIAPGALSKLFDPFFTTKEVGQGTGLGLSISHGVIQSHGGRIWAESEAGKGATFIIELPLISPPCSPSPE